MNLLARREHSRHELLNKLGRRFANPTLVEEVLQSLSEENLQSDQRYAESLLRQRIARGYGPGRIHRDMRERGLDDETIDKAHAVVQPEWFALAEAAYARKFGNSPLPGRVDDEPDPDFARRRAAREAALKEKAKRSRFMQYRGFQPQHFHHLLED
ncbi:recombination regulator RecX [Kineobactrum sediminis]|uniref:Regulatory protein RecX n=1 Tax=Kineobactrum sediminis TaxID=1905677 RepID=A0A2N5Y2Z5_9GAMM|nr:regulatory protein RecX [Kineobactrum sediminis]PLW82747.1 recombination regulator RecX [Kineobactrum sediminis]